MKRLLGEKFEISRRIMNQASNASGTTHTTITLLDTSSASFSMGGGSSIHSNGEISIGDHADVSNSTTSSQSTASSARASGQATNKIFNYKDQKDIEYANSLTCEDICFSMCRQLKILPTTRLLFGLRVLDSENEWAIPGLSLRPGVRYCFRMRIKVPNMDTQLKNLDKEAYEYLYWQIRYDIVNEKIPEIRHPEKKDNVMGFAVMDMSIDLEAKSSASERLEKNYKREIIEKIESNYKRYLPQTLLKEHKYFVKSKICATFKNVREKKIGFTEFKFYYISEVCKLAPTYLMEMYVATVNYIPNDDLLMVRTPTSGRGDSGTRVFVKLDTHDHPEPGLKISREKVKWTLLTKIEDIFAICIGGDVCALLEITGLPQGYRMQFGSRTELESFITYISGYSRLTAKWMTDLCANFQTPSLQKLKDLKCHGPIGGAFSFAKLRELSLNGATCLIRQCEKEYDVYYIDKAKTKLEKSLAVDVLTTKITRENNKWLLHSNDGVKAFDDLKDLRNSISTKILWPSEYEKAPLLLICLPKNLQPKKTDTELSDAELRKRKVQIFDRKQDLRWYQNTERMCDNGKIMLVRGDWIQGGVCKDVSVMLKIFLSESNPKEFTDLASFCSQIFSAQFLKLHGLTLNTPYTMVMEYYHAPLDEFLRKNKDEISLQMLISIVYDLARGIEYLRVKHMHHGFIRCSNLYVTKYDLKSNCIETKIGDPGIRRAYSHEDLPWIPQEYYNNPDGVRGDECADEWAFATTIWEIFAYGKSILEELECIGKPAKIVEKLLMNRSRTGGILLKPSECCPEEISNMMFDGWSLDASNRFQTGNIFGTLNTLIGRYRPSYERIFTNEREDHLPYEDSDSDNDIDNENSGNCDAFSSQSITPFISPNQGFSHTGMPGRPWDDTQWVLTLPIGKVIIIKQVAQGHYGTVHWGELRYNDPNTAPEEVAVKKFKPEATSNPKDFLREIKIMQSMNHPNVVKIKYSVRKPISIVMEYVSGGSFLVLLKTSNLTNNKLLHFASDIARGMEYLVSKQIIHRDLATRNILWDKEKDYVKISDFGLSQFANADGYYWGFSQRDIPIKWYSPESIAYNKFSMKSDVWSYGVTMFETFSGGDMPNLVPNRELSQDEFLQRLQLGERLRKPDLCPQIVYDKLMLPCWQADPKARPTFTALLDSIRSIMFEGAAI
ncbi:tyrosine-protein kinase hopscotch-like [Rhagoletis pomonella]|uniref:tyrosine-protein kinase hopscotch-like n=1 Tax=Rhagoletis pomonella TaxID=28610 RepID=UPI00177EFAE3|nr:tyrosine-protein kinase hopscotch-like [Rhagoletis pomonella]